MSIASPREPVYYYECSGGRFRLVHFLPPNRLRELADHGKIKTEVLEDFPDGVDLDCTAPDFDDFHRQYGYRPQRDPDALQRAFFAILSATKDWQRFQGAGIIAAADLERRVEPVEQALHEEEAMPQPVAPVPMDAPLPTRRAVVGRRAAQQTRMVRALERMPVAGIDPGQTLRQQKFSSISMDEGEPAEDVFAELHQGRRRPEGAP